ncbi:MAG: hypothetical protein AB7G21_07785 [Dehalococcoidia bacterium]
MRLRLHHVLVLLGLTAGIIVGTLVETEPRYVGWLFALGGGLAGGAFLAAILSGDALASGPAPRAGRGARGRPAWFDEDEDASTPPDDSRN